MAESDTREKLIREKVDLIDAIDYAMRDFDDYLDECNETCTPPIDKLEDFIADGVISAGYRKKQEWIPVSERLPEEMEWVMCACVDGEVNILRYDHIMDDWDLFHRPNRCYKKEYVTHWMPLPSLPKGE